MSVHHLWLRTDYGSLAELSWDAAQDPDVITLGIKERGVWTAPELRDFADKLKTVADALESESAEWRAELMHDAGFVERRAGRSAA